MSGRPLAMVFTRPPRRRVWGPRRPMNVASGRVGHRSSALGSDSSDASFAGHRTGARITVVTGPYAVAIMVVALVLAAWAVGLVLAIRPAVVAWGWGERSRAGTAVVAVGFLIMPVMVIRVQQVWAGPVG